jgi:cell wall-associated NlpC family hydrolase
MTGSRMSIARRPRTFVRRAIVTLVTGAGLALTPLPALANTAPPPPAAAPPASVPAPTAAAQTAVNTALAQLGDPYAWGGAGPDAFDCSGLTEYAYAAAGVYLPHSSSMQSEMGVPVSLTDLQPGDLVFFYTPVSHVAMYIGNGQIVQASTYGQPVAVTELAYMPDFVGARRLT